jgi:hypothetical protein
VSATGQPRRLGLRTLGLTASSCVSCVVSSALHPLASSDAKAHAWCVPELSLRQDVHSTWDSPGAWMHSSRGSRAKLSRMPP